MLWLRIRAVLGPNMAYFVLIPYYTTPSWPLVFGDFSVSLQCHSDAQCLVGTPPSTHPKTNTHIIYIEDANTDC